MPVMIADLPGDVLVQILGQLNPVEVLNFGLASKRCQAAFQNVSEQIWREVALGYFDAHTPIVDHTRGFERITYPGMTALQRAIASQRTVSTCYSETTTWNEFVQTKQKIRSAWKKGTPSLKTGQINLGPIPELSKRALQVCGDLQLGLFFADDPISMNSRSLVLAVPWSDIHSKKQPCRHQVLATHSGHFLHYYIDYTDNQVVVFTEGDQDRHTIHVGRLCVTSEPNDKYFLHDRIAIRPVGQIAGFKARYPYLLVSSVVEDDLDDDEYDQRWLIYSLEDGRLLETYDDMPYVAFISDARLDFDADCIMVGHDDDFLLIQRHRSTAIELLPPSLTQIDLYPQTTALAHSLDGKHLLVGTYSGYLFWYHNFRDWSSLSDEARRKSLVWLHFEREDNERSFGIYHVFICEGRVVFQVQGLPSAIYIFELFDWENTADFMDRRPKIRSIQIADGDCKVSVDAAAIYVRYTLKASAWSSDQHDNRRLGWYDDGGRLGDALVEEVWAVDSPEFHRAQRTNMTEGSILIYDFAAQSARES